jgi:glutamate formiminotransferase/formiminotetrahydrofolate cyclodeaminase
MAAFGLPKGSEAEKKLRQEAIQQATRTAIEVPFHVMETAFESFALIRAMAAGGNPNSVSDAGVGALCARAAVLGAFLNVRINAAGYSDKGYVVDILGRGAAIAERTMVMEKEILDIVNGKIGG